MDPSSTLIGLAEIALALAGFAAIALMLGARGASLEPEHASTVRVMVINALGSAFFCLLTVATLAVGIEPPLVWSLMSGFGVLALLVGSVLNYVLFLRHLRGVNPRLAGLWWSWAVVAGGIQLVNALGFFGPPSFGLLLLGTVVLLGQAGALFVHMVFVLLDRSAG